MALLFNVESGRDLREGDEIRVLEGRLSGQVGKVLGFHLLSESPVVIQTRSGVAGYAANEVEFLREGPNKLEPLPPVITLLQEGKIEESYSTCSSMLCLRLTETSTVLTLVPTQHCKIKDVLTSALRESKSFGEAVEAALAKSFVTRLPHLVESRNSKELDRLLLAGASADDVLAKL
jgi:hypothetical protein